MAASSLQVMTGQMATREFYLSNPSSVEVSVTFERFPANKGFSLSFDEAHEE